MVGAHGPGGAGTPRGTDTFRQRKGQLTEPVVLTFAVVAHIELHAHRRFHAAADDARGQILKRRQRLPFAAYEQAGVIAAVHMDVHAVLHDLHFHGRFPEDGADDLGGHFLRYGGKLFLIQLGERLRGQAFVQGFVLIELQ